MCNAYLPACAHITVQTVLISMMNLIYRVSHCIAVN